MVSLVSLLESVRDWCGYRPLHRRIKHGFWRWKKRPEKAAFAAFTDISYFQNTNPKLNSRRIS